MQGLQGDNTHCFELYGFDILLDSALRPWLLEVNVCPSLSSGSKLDQRVKTALMCDLFTLVGAPLPDDSLKPTQSKNSHEQRKALKRLQCAKVLSLDAADRDLLEALSDEFNRTGAFDLLFPLSRNVDYYSQFFLKHRYSNCLLWRWLKTQKS